MANHPQAFQPPALPILPIQQTGQQQGGLFPLQPGGQLALQTPPQVPQPPQQPFIPIPGQQQQQPTAGIVQAGAQQLQAGGGGGNIASTLGGAGITAGSAALIAGQPEAALPLFLVGAGLSVIGTLFDDSGEKQSKENKRQFNENLALKREQFEFGKPLLEEQGRLQTQAARANLGIAGAGLSTQVGSTISRLAQNQRTRNIRGSGRAGI